MAYSNQDKRSPATGSYACNGSVVDFAGTFYVQSAAQVKPLLYNSLGEESEITTGFSISPTGGSYPADSFTLTTDTPYVSGFSIVLLRDIEYTQETDFGNRGPYLPENVEEADDKSMLGLLQISEVLDRCVKQSASDADALDTAAYLAACEAYALRAEAAVALAGDPIIGESWMASAAQQTFITTLTQLPANLAAIEVYIDGVKQLSDSITINGSNSFDVGAALAGGEIVELITRSPSQEVLTGTVNAWTGQQYFARQVLTYGTNVSWDLSSQQMARLTLTGDATLDNPTNMNDGGTYSIEVVQDGTGGHTLSFGSAYQWPNGSSPLLTEVAGTVSIIHFDSDGTNMRGVYQPAFS